MIIIIFRTASVEEAFAIRSDCSSVLTWPRWNGSQLSMHLSSFGIVVARLIGKCGCTVIDHKWAQHFDYELKGA